MKPKMDIDQLARQAAEAADAVGSGRSLSGPGTHRGRRIKHALAGFVLTLPFLVLQVHFSWIDRLEASIFPARLVTQGQADMKVVLATAREAVEAARSGSGALPDTLPGAALAALVQYQRAGTSYRLSMSDGYSLATMEMDGSVGFQLLNP